jgi:hypothetical protein
VPNGIIDKALEFGSPPSLESNKIDTTEIEGLHAKADREAQGLGR